MRAVPRKLLIIASLLLLAGLAQAKVSVHEGESIQRAMDAADPGETIEVYSGTYLESLVVRKSLILLGIDSGSGMPAVVSDRGSAITILADNVTLKGFRTKSTSGWSEDAGIVVAADGNLLQGNAAEGCSNSGIILSTSHGNVLRDNSAVQNRNEGIALRNASSNLLENNRADQNRYGLKMVDSSENTIINNAFSDNRFEGMYLQGCNANVLEKNYALGNSGGIFLESSRDNIIIGNDLIDNEKGISISNRNASESLISGKKGVSISYSGMPSDDPRHSSNNTIFLNNLSNLENAYDDGLNHWDSGSIGNNYSNFNDPEEGCTGGRICSAEYSISGGSSRDRFPLSRVTAPKAPAEKASGAEGTSLTLERSYFLPGREIRANFTAPSDSEAWAALSDGNRTWDEQYLGRNNSGLLAFTAPENEGSYRLTMYDGTGKEIVSLPFNVTVPRISASPKSVRTCEKIIVSYSGAPGLEKDWIGMFSSGSSEPLSRQYLKKSASGDLAFSTQESGTYHFALFEAGVSTSLCTSNSVEAVAKNGVKVIAEPSRVSPGGSITVTFWGAPASGTGVLGMYGMTRPDKFHIEKRPIGSRSCGTMTFRAPSKPGQYDFRMFENDIYRPLMAQSNVVTVA